MVTFTATGHKNIKATHKTTLEFTKDPHVTPQGDCIIAVNANFNVNEIKPLLQKKSVIITIKTKNHEETITAIPNPKFNDPHEIVIRITDFISPRTCATRANKASKDINRNLIKELQNPHTKVTITIK